jgi:hypothetical protein
MDYKSDGMFMVARFKKIGNVQKRTTDGKIIETTYGYLKERLVVKEVAGVIEQITHHKNGSSQVWVI